MLINKHFRLIHNRNSYLERLKRFVYIVHHVEVCYDNKKVAYHGNHERSISAIARLSVIMESILLLPPHGLWILFCLLRIQMYWCVYLLSTAAIPYSVISYIPSEDWGHPMSRSKWIVFSVRLFHHVKV